jgi:hypothetical protein
MRYNTVEDTIADFVNFAQNAILPFDPTGSSQASKAPWVFIGGSMSGAFVSWTEKLYPGGFWAYWASSATTEGISSWSYTIPILESMPQNCSRDVALVVDYMDHIGVNGTKEEQTVFQDFFGMKDIEHFDDFAW